MLLYTDSFKIMFRKLLFRLMRLQNIEYNIYQKTQSFEV